MNSGKTVTSGRFEDGLLADLLDLFPEHFYVADSEMRFVYANKALADWLGHSKEELVGKLGSDFDPDTQYAREFAQRGREIMASGASHVGDLKPYRKPDGTVTHLRCYEVPFKHPRTDETMMIGLVQDLSDRIEREHKERQIAVMDREMQIARDIQRSVLPRELRTDWAEVFGFSEPAAYAGGDFYDWRRLPDGSLVLALGDVTGHGVGPALVAAECRAYWRVLAPSLPLRDAVLRMNELVADDCASQRFVTFAAAKLSPRGSLEVFSAGQGPLILRRQGGDVELLGSHMLPLGIESDMPVSENVTTRELSPGDALLLFSDGFTETRNPQGEQWTTRGLLSALDRGIDLTGTELLREIERENVEFAQHAAPADDRTIVLARFRGRSIRGATPETERR